MAVLSCIIRLAEVPGDAAVLTLAPGQIESREVFAEAVGVVGDFAVSAGHGEETATGFAQRGAGAADADHAGELGAVEEVELGSAVGAEDFVQEGFVRAGGGHGLPGGAEANEFGVEDGPADATTGSERGHAGDGGVEVAEVGAPFRVGGAGEGEERRAHVFGHADAAAHAFGGGFEFVVEVGFDVFGALGEAGELEAPEVDAREEVFAEVAGTHVGGKVAVGAGHG